MNNVVKENPYKAIYKGYYYAVIPENMAIPKAIFLLEVEATKYSGDEWPIRCLPLPESLFLQALHQCSYLP